MAISGLVVTLVDDAAAAGDAIELLRGDTRLTIGERCGRRVAVVAETPDAESDRSLFDELHALPGIEHVDVTFVGVDGPASPGDTGLRAGEERTHDRR